jgi:YjjG family noncanonical pyrimidine nucleotidase
MMKKHYPWLWFDADNTLFDYNLAEATALKQAFTRLDLLFEDSHLELYRGINQGLWQALERHEITPALLRTRRFELLLQAIQQDGSPEKIDKVYLEQLGSCTDLIDGAYEVLQTLHRTCRIAILTNGLQITQRARLARSTIRPFISEIIVSEEIGVAKPQAAFFEAASARTGHPPKSEVLLIGDSLTSDIPGGVNYGIDTCWYNPTAVSPPEELSITHEIRHLRELLEVIG